MRDEQDHGESQAPTDEARNPTRRSLLGAAGGFALAASGLLLPDRLVEDAEARAGALDGAKGGRRGNDHKGRHRKRSHGDKKDKRKDRDKPRGFVPTNVAMNVINNRSVPVNIRGWLADKRTHWYVPDGWDWEPMPPTTPPQLRQFVGHGDFSGMWVQIGTDRVVYFAFTWPIPPYAAIYSGWWDSNGWQPKGQGEILADKDHMFIDESFSAPGITAERVADSADHVWLKVDLT